MKIEHQHATITELTGSYSDEVTFPNGKKGKISFSFEYGVEFDTLSVDNGLLIVDSQSSVTFSRHGSTLWSNRIGPVPEDVGILGILSEHIARVKDKMKYAKVEVKFNV